MQRGAILLRPPRFAFDFTAATMPAGAALTRASAGSYFDNAGALQSAATDVARFDYSTAAILRGLLVEPARTNGIRNNTMAGAVAGTPGTRPTNWTGGTLGGLTLQIVSISTVSGVVILRVHLSGTTNTTSFSPLIFEGTTSIAASDAQTWSQSIYIALVAAGTSLTNVTLVRLDQVQYPAGTDNFSSDFKSSLISTLQPFSWAKTFSYAAMANVQPRLTLGVTNGAAVDITLDIGLPQQELGAFATSPISTSSATVARSADVLTLAVPSANYIVDVVGGSLTASGALYRDTATVTGGSWTFAWPAAAVTAGERHLRSVALRRTA